MANSFAESITHTCAACGQEFEVEFWLIVDCDERPDPVERIRAGVLHDLACSYCRDPGHMDAPLQCRPDADPTILFAPAEQTGAEEDGKQAYQLVDLLRESLGAAWREGNVQPFSYKVFYQQWDGLVFLEGGANTIRLERAGVPPVTVADALSIQNQMADHCWATVTDASPTYVERYPPTLGRGNNLFQ